MTLCSGFAYDQCACKSGLAIWYSQANVCKLSCWRTSSRSDCSDTFLQNLGQSVAHQRRIWQWTDAKYLVKNREELGPFVVLNQNNLLWAWDISNRVGIMIGILLWGFIQGSWCCYAFSFRRINQRGLSRCIFRQDFRWFHTTSNLDYAFEIIEIWYFTCVSNWNGSQY